VQFRNPVSLSEAGKHHEEKKTATVATEKLTVEIPSFVDNPIRHLAVDLHLKLTPLANEALAKFVADYTKKSAEGGHITLPKDKSFREMPERGEKWTVMIDKEILKGVKHSAVDWETDPRQIIIFAFTKFLAANGIKIKEPTT
jgi:hypothetical protein